MNIDYGVYLYGTPENRGRATYIHPVSGYVWVDADSGTSDFVSPRDIIADDDAAFRADLARVNA